MDRIVQTFNPEVNGGEAILLVTEVNRENGEVTLEQEIVLNSYGSQATIGGMDVFTPANLRRIADELEVKIKAK